MSKTKNTKPIKHTKHIKEPLIDNVILIDTSYTSFHRFFATLKWISIVNPEIYKENFNNPDYNWLENEQFMEKYNNLYLSKIERSVGKKVFNKSLIIFCMDTPKENVWRTTDLNCNYKSDRIDLSLKNNFKPIFKHTYTNLIPKFLKNSNNIFKMRIDKLEADDIIGLVTKYLEEKFPNKNIYIMSGDQDFYQLGRDKVYFINYKTKKALILNKAQALLELHKKILLGDKSDCIPSIFPNKFPSKTKKELIESIEKFEIFIKDNKEIEDKYKQNIKLINFDYIPTKYKDIVIEEFNDIINKFINNNILF